MGINSFGAAASLKIGGDSYTIHRLDALAESHDLARLPYSIKVLLENLLRKEDGVNVRVEDIDALASYATTGPVDREIAFSPARILLQDLTGVPVVVDLAALRDSVVELGGKPDMVNPLIPVDLVIDHSLIAEVSARPDALEVNSAIEFDRNIERYRFLRWGQQAFSNFRVVPPGTGICHQVNLELLSRVVFADDAGNAYPDTLVGTDSHTPMVNGLGIVAWGVGGIEAEAAMLGQPIPLLIPSVVGLRLEGELPEGTTATDLVLTIAELLRQHRVVGKFVEVFGPGVASVPVENRATIGNMSPEYGSTVTIFPIDDDTLRYLRLTGRDPALVRLVETYAKEQGLWNDPSIVPAYTETLTLDLATVVPSLAGPARPQDRVPLNSSKSMFRTALAKSLGSQGDERATSPVDVQLAVGEPVTLDHGSVVIAAITSCTNTSNPQVMIAAGLLAKRAVERGLSTKAWVKTSLAPGSRVVVDYYDRAGLTSYLDKLGFELVGFGCTTCIGNSGPLAPEVSSAISEHGLSCVAVLSGNRNFEGRVHPDVRMNYLASPPLVVAYAIAGTMDLDLYTEPLGTDPSGAPVYLRDIWPSTREVLEVTADAVQSSMFTDDYAAVSAGDARWQGLESPAGGAYTWNESTYVKRPPFLDPVPAEASPVADVVGARVLAVLGDSITTDHISPAGAIKATSPAGKWLAAHGVAPHDFNSLGTRRGNDEVMIRGTFSNARIKNALVPGVEGGVSIHLPDGEQGTIYDVAMRYAEDGVPLVIFAGKEYGSGSSRDWAAKGAALLGVRAVITESFERIHRSNLIGMGVAPLQYVEGDFASHGLTGHEEITITGLAGVVPADLIRRTVTVSADGVEFEALLRIDTPTEAEYFVAGGILPYVARRLAKA